MLGCFTSNDCSQIPYTQYMCNIQINSYKSHCVKNVYNNKWQSQLSLVFCMECNMAIGADFS